jgi:hypothetical protein
VADADADAAPASLVVATNSAVLRVLDAATLACTRSLAGHADTVLCCDVAGAGAAAAARAPPGAQLVASGGKDRCLRLWDAARGACLGASEGHVAAVTAVAFGSRSAALLVTGGADKLLKVWDASAAIAAAGSEVRGPRARGPRRASGGTQRARGADENIQIQRRSAARKGGAVWIYQSSFLKLIRAPPPPAASCGAFRLRMRTR